MVVQTFNLMNLVFLEILKFSPSVLAKYATLTDKLLYLILIPHVVLLLFLFSFGMWAAKGHRGFQMLISIAGYLAIVLSGWYGQFLAPLISGFFILWLALAFIGFIAVRIIPPIYGPGIRDFGRSIAELAASKTVGKSAKIKALKKQLDAVNNRITAVGKLGPSEAREAKLADLHELKSKIEDAIKEEEGD